MNPSLLSVLIFCLLFILLAGGMPIGFAMGLSAFLGTLLLIDAGAALALLGQTAYETALTYGLSVIPMFVLMGYIAGEAGLNESLYRACNAWLGHRRGGLALATIGGCGAFAAICGSSLATAATMSPDRAPGNAPLQLRRPAGDRSGRGRRDDRHFDPAQRDHGDLRPSDRDQHLAAVSCRLSAGNTDGGRVHADDRGDDPDRSAARAARRALLAARKTRGVSQCVGGRRHCSCWSSAGSTSASSPL